MNKFDKIEHAIQEYHFALERNNHHTDEDGIVHKRWDYYQNQLRIAQAACSYAGYIVTGTRHFCPIMHLQIEAIGSDLLDEWMMHVQGNMNIKQGFTDQYGNFLTRKEAYPIALAAGQIIRKDHCPGTLYSECYI